MQTLEIRPAVAADQATVLALAERLVAFELPPGRSRETLLALDARLLCDWFCAPPEGSHLLVAARKGAVVGFALLTRRLDQIDGSRLMHLQALAVDAECAGQGIGRQLITACEALARAAGVAALGLNALSGNAGARRLYRHLGFAEELVSYRKPL